MPIADQNRADEKFWCNLAAESIYNAPERRSKSIEALKSVITWILGLFSTGGLALGLFGGVKEFSIVSLVSLGVGFAFLLIAYAKAYESGYPVAKSFSPLVSKEVAEALSETIKAQTRLFQHAVRWTSVGAFFVALGILVAFGSMHREQPPATVKPWPIVTASLQKKGDTSFVAVMVMGNKNDLYTLSLLGDVGKTRHSLFYRPFLADTAGRLYNSLPFFAGDSIKNVTLMVARCQRTDHDTTVDQTTTVKMLVK
jgi:hypothetical protein